MFSGIKLRALNPATTTTSLLVPQNRKKKNSINTQNRISFRLLNNNNLQLPKLHHFSSLSSSLQSEASSTGSPSLFTSSVGSPSPTPLIQLNLTNRHLLILNAIACAAAISSCWLFFSAIPTLLAFRRAAESIEKLLDDTREELPDTMAAVRLSGMEISDLTMELSDLGQEITQGVRRSTRAVRVAEERIRSLTNIKPTGASQSRN